MDERRLEVNSPSYIFQNRIIFNLTFFIILCQLLMKKLSAQDAKSLYKRELFWPMKEDAFIAVI